MRRTALLAIPLATVAVLAVGCGSRIGPAASTQAASPSPTVLPPGSLVVVWQAKTSSGAAPSSQQMSEASAIMGRRLSASGFAASQVHLQLRGRDQIAATLPGAPNTDQALLIIGQTGQLELYVDADTRIAGPAASPAAVLRRASGRISNTDLEKLQAYLKHPTSAPADTNYSLISAPKGVYGDNMATVYFLYRHKPAMDGGAISGAAQSRDAAMRRADVSITFTATGAATFERLTRQLAESGARLAQNQSFAIVLDSVMESDPVVDYKQNPTGISGDKAIITGNFTVTRARSLAVVLNSGALPVTLTLIERTVLN